MKILITGSAGFIGFHIAHELLRRGDEIIGIDNMNPYYDINLKKKRNAILKDYPDYHFYNVDITNRKHIDTIFHRKKIDIVLHLAAYANVRHSIKCPEKYIDTNIGGFFNIIDACRIHYIPKFLYASSSSVYGDSNMVPYGETQRTDGQLCIYGVSKKTNELMAQCYSQLYDIQTIGFRFFTVYGPWSKPDMATWLFTEAIYNNKPIALYNDGKNKRDFTYIDDVVSAVCEAIESKQLQQIEVMNIGNNKEIALPEIITIIEERLKKKAIINYLPQQMGESRTTFADIQLAKKKIDFEPITDIRNGLNKFIDWYLEYVKD